MHRTLHKLKSWIFPCILFLIVVTILISQLIFPTSGSDRFFLGEAEIYYQNLQEAGFPEDYAAELTELHMLHPSWSFSPLLVTQQEPQYTWSYVIDKEHENPRNNILYSSVMYGAYHHPTNTEIYDSGHYQVSREALEYFMDPRNFLNETDIFQFYSLSGANPSAQGSVESILRGTFMEDVVLENGMTYAQYFVWLGNELDINPIFLATKVRQEQGVVGTSPLISGVCGNKLLEFAESSGYTKEELLGYNGYYNYFNISATGSGSFQIYLNAIRYAKEKGTEAMKDEWSSSSSWDTRWKALYGGAYFLANNYIGKNQDTVYLQKFNVDSRAVNNFSHQYMASVHGAMSEARMLFQSFSTMNLLDEAALFIIPVYEGMPMLPCPDPAAGTCNQTAQATKRYEFHSELNAPVYLSANTSSMYLQEQIYSGDRIDFVGSVTHKYGIEGLSYAWDGGEWINASDTNTLKTGFVCDFLDNTTHILVIRGTASYQTAAKDTLRTNFIYAVIYVTVIPRPNVNVTYHVGDTTTTESYQYGSLVNLPRPQTPNFIGWKGSDGSFLPESAEVEMTDDLSYSAVFWDFQQLEGASLVAFENTPRLRFSAAMRKEDYEFLSSCSTFPFSYEVRLQNNGQETLLILSDVASSFMVEKTQWVRFDAMTAPLKPSDYKTPYSASFSVNIRYTNGAQVPFSAKGPASVRCAQEVAKAALADKTVVYSDELLTLLRLVTQND